MPTLTGDVVPGLHSSFKLPATATFPSLSKLLTQVTMKLFVPLQDNKRIPPIKFIKESQ